MSAAPCLIDKIRLKKTLIAILLDGIIGVKKYSNV